MRCVFALLALLTALPAVAQRTLTYAELLSQLHDFDRLMRPLPGVEAGQFSSYHRDEATSWGLNADAGNYVREEPNGEQVMMELDGPGCIYRVWSANPMGTIRIYLDGAATPSYEFEFLKLFDGSTPPFLAPLCWRRGEGVNQASDCYVPIPFARHIKITQDQRRPQFYHFNYLKFPADWTVPSFHLPLDAAEQAALEAARAAWSACGTDPKPKLRGQTTIKRTITLQPGQTAVLCDLRGAGQIRALRVQVDCAQRYFWRKLVLQANWDGADWPQILSPLGPFFAFDWQTAEYASLPAGCVNGRAYFYYPMPFRTSARMTLRSYLEVPATITYELEHAPVAPPADALYFYCRWRTEKDSPTFDYPFIETAGRGHLVGIALQIDHPIGGWWGEGDEKIWIDDDAMPRWIGTGSEDYFGDAWGIRYLPGASWGCSLDAHPRTCPYRWHFVDLVPFAKRLRATIENYGSWGNFDHEHEYNSTAYWYQAELTPPFGQLEGVRYTGGEYQAPPRPLDWNPRAFGPIRAGDLLTHGLNVPYAIEAENLLGGTRGGRLVSDVGRENEYSLERAVAFDHVAAGDELARFELPVSQAAVYYPTLYTDVGDGLAELALKLGGETLEPIGQPRPGVVELTGVYLEAGRHEATLVARTAGRAVLDALALPRAQRADGVMEAESMHVARAAGGEARAVVVRGFSGGRALLLAADGPGASLTFELDRVPERAYVLGVRPAVGAAGVQLQAFIGGRPIGPVHDTWAEGGPRPGPSILPLGLVPPGTREIEIRVLGKRAESAGYHLALDYFRWEPEIIHADSTPGIWAEVAATHGCEYRIQDLGERFTAGHHLWVQPSSPGAWIDIAVTIPAEGNYSLETRLTTSWDYAVVQPLLDGAPLGQPVDTYTAEVLQTPPLDLGTHRLTAGRHVIRFHAVGKNDKSAGHLMGIDYLKLVRLP